MQKRGGVLEGRRSAGESEMPIPGEWTEGEYETIPQTFCRPDEWIDSAENEPEVDADYEAWRAACESAVHGES